MKRDTLCILPLVALMGCTGTQDLPAPAIPLNEVTPQVLTAAPFTLDTAPNMGTISATFGRIDLAWLTLDFSVGAFDASAYIRDNDGSYGFGLTGYDPEDMAISRRNRIAIRGTLAAAAPGVAQDVTIAIIDADFDGPQFRHSGPATVTFDTLTHDGAFAGTATGRFAATLCRAISDTAPLNSDDCRALAGQFTTDMQFDNFPLPAGN